MFIQLRLRAKDYHFLSLSLGLVADFTIFLVLNAGTVFFLMLSMLWIWTTQKITAFISCPYPIETICNPTALKLCEVTSFLDHDPTSKCHLRPGF